MKIETLTKANQLYKDCDNIGTILSRYDDKERIKVDTARGIDIYFSKRLQAELAEWLREKKKEYQEELDNL